VSIAGESIAMRHVLGVLLGESSSVCTGGERSHSGYIFFWFVCPMPQKKREVRGCAGSKNRTTLRQDFAVEVFC